MYWLLAVAMSGCGGSDDPCKALMNGDQGCRQACIDEEMLRLDDRTVSMAAVQRLSGLAPESIAPLRKALRGGKTALIRANAADALGRVDATHPEIGDAVPDLAAALRHESPLVRRQAAGALGRIGSRAKAALGELERRLDDSDLLVRQVAQMAIASISKSSK